MNHNPSTTTLETAQVEGFYHIYARTCRERSVFREPADFIVFLALLKQYLRLQKLLGQLDGRPPEPAPVELHAYNLTPKNFQLLMRTKTELAAVSYVIRAVTVSYEGYFGRKYRNREPLFYDVYKSTKIAEQQIVIELSQALHREHLGWEQSSRDYYLGHEVTDWLQVQPIIDLAGGRAVYRRGLSQARPSRRTPKRVRYTRSNLLRSSNKTKPRGLPAKLLVDNFWPESG